MPQVSAGVPGLDSPLPPTLASLHKAPSVSYENVGMYEYTINIQLIRLCLSSAYSITLQSPFRKRYLRKYMLLLLAAYVIGSKQLSLINYKSGTPTIQQNPKSCTMPIPQKCQPQGENTSFTIYTLYIHFWCSR